MWFLSGCSPWSLRCCGCCSGCGYAGVQARLQPSQTEPGNPGTDTGRIPAFQLPIRPPKPHTALRNVQLHITPVCHTCSEDLLASLTLLLRLHAGVSHVHLLVLQQLFRVHQEATALQTLVVLSLLKLRDALDGHSLHFPLLASVDLLMNQHILQCAEKLMTLAAHEMVLHVDSVRLLLLSHAPSWITALGMKGWSTLALWPVKTALLRTRMVHKRIYDKEWRVY